MGPEGAAMVGVLLVAPWPLWRLAASAPVRHRRRDQLALLGVLGGYAGVVVLVAIGWPAALPALVGVALAAGTALWWRSRPGFGARSRVPPGRILVHPSGLYEDPEHLLRLAERYGPIFKIGATFPVPTLTPIICIVGHDLGLELLRDHEGALEVHPPFPASRLIPRGFMRNMSRADHDRFAPVFRHAVSGCLDAAFEQDVATTARSVLARMAGADAADGGTAPRPYLRDFVFDVLARLHFGYASGSPEQARLASEFRTLGIARFWRWSPDRTRRKQWSAAVERVEAAFRAAPTTTRSVLGEALATGLAGDTLVGNVLQMQESGTGDLSSLLVWVVKHLGDHPDWVERLAAESSATGPRSLGERVIRESLRLEQSEYLSRRTTQDIEFHGFRLPRGWRIRICVREAHRDHRTFDRPSEFDPDRFLDHAYPLRAYAPLGLYRHRCIGAPIVHLVGRIFVQELARCYRLSIVDDGPREHGRFHWQPSPRLRIRLEPRSGPVAVS